VSVGSFEEQIEVVISSGHGHGFWGLNKGVHAVRSKHTGRHLLQCRRLEELSTYVLALSGCEQVYALSDDEPHFIGVIFLQGIQQGRDL
jgi:hypothetical protein